MLAVGATDDTDGLYFWSSRGPWVALTAPGCNIVLNPPPGRSCGTSFTPAAVAGVAGLLLSRNPSLTRHQIAAALAATAKPIPGIAFGRINPLAAFEYLGLLAAGAVAGWLGRDGDAADTTTPGTRTPASGQLYYATEAVRDRHLPSAGSAPRGASAGAASRRTC